jgi:hypothetical protein
MTRTGGCSKSGLGPGRFPPPCGERSTTAIVAAASRAVASASRRGTTSATGRKGDPLRSPTSRCSVAGITARCTRRAMGSSEGLTVRCDSDGRMAGPCPRCHHRRRCRLIRSAPSGRVTTCRACSSTRAACAGWLGERPDVGWAIDVLHPLAGRPAGPPPNRRIDVRSCGVTQRG